MPTNGDIYFDGIWLNSCSSLQWETLRRTSIGIIFQNLNLVPSWTALEQVEAALEDIVPSSNKRRIRAIAMLEEMGLADRLNHLPGELSMGEQQRVAIARTLIREPKLILADEPTGDLDPRTAEDILYLLHKQVLHSKTALLVATHGNFPEIYFDRRYFLNNKSLVPFPATFKNETLTLSRQ